MSESPPKNLVKGDFPHTRWSLVVDAKEGDPATRSKALAELCEQYWYPLYAFVRRSGSHQHDAEDLTQGFFTQLLRNDSIQLFSQSKGRLRSYLLGAIKNYLSNERSKAHAQKRGGGQKVISLNLTMAEERYLAEPSTPGSPETLFQLRWALDLLNAAFSQLEEEYRLAGKHPIYLALKSSIGGDHSGTTHAEVAASLGITEGNARVALHRLRKRYRRVLEELIADTVVDPSEVNDEIDALHRVFNEL